MSASEELDDLERRDRRRNWVWIVWCALIGIFLVFLFFPRATFRSGNRVIYPLNNARQFQMASQMMNLDTINADQGPGAWPADLGVQSMGEYLDLLVKGNYLSAEDVEKLRFREDFVLLNVAESDPADTALIVSKGYFYRSGSLPGWQNNGFVLFTKGGQGSISLHESSWRQVKFPPRTPAILPE